MLKKVISVFLVLYCINLQALEEIYLDYQATTPVDPAVVKEMEPYLTKEFGNPHSSTHEYGKRASQAVSIARKKVANLIGSNDLNTIVFTSGATEANNIAILGSARALKRSKKKVITCITEHKSVLETVKSLEHEGFEVIFLGVGKNGLISLDELKKNLDNNTALVSIMTVNNEIGVIQPIAKIGELAHKYGALFHTDATQGVGKIPLDVQSDNIDLLSMSGHKIYGPKGVGALYIRNGVKIDPIIHGGGQEKGIRPGTVPVFLTVGLGKAAELAKNNLVSESKKIEKMRNYFLLELKKHNIPFLIHGSMQSRIAGNLNISFKNINGEELIPLLPQLAVSLGSACSSSNVKLSYVVCALKTVVKPWGSPIRIGFGRFSSFHDVKIAATALVEAVNSFKNRKNSTEKKINYTLTNNYELVYVFLGRCPYCHIFAPIVKNFANKHKFSITAITVDGGKVRDFPNAIFDINFATKSGINAFPTLLARKNSAEQFKVIVVGALYNENELLKAFYAVEHNQEQTEKK